MHSLLSSLIMQDAKYQPDFFYGTSGFAQLLVCICLDISKVFAINYVVE